MCVKGHALEEGAALMDFLTPLFAAVGVAAAAVPVVLHMLRRAPTQEMPFSLVRFLKPSQPKLTKRSHIEHWPLMLLRMLALVLIGLAFARPFLRDVISAEADDATAQAVTILVDKSASMRRDGIYEAVQRTIREVVAELNGHDLLAVSEFSQSTRQLLSREQWAMADSGERQAFVDSVLGAYEPDWMPTNTGAAMRLAADELALESLERINVERRRLVLITDFQRGSQLDELKSGDWPAHVEVDLRTVQPTQRGNVGVSFVADRRLDRTRVRISSAGDSVQQEFTLQPFDVSGSPVGESIRVDIAPGQRRSLLLPPLDAKNGQTVVGVELLGDDHPFDNVIDLPELQNPVIRVAHIGPAAFNDPDAMRYYLQRVLAGNAERDVQLVDLLKNEGVVLPIPEDVPYVVATDVVPAGLMDSLSRFLNGGGTLLMAAPTVQAVESLTEFLPVNFQVTEAEVAGYAMFGSIDFDHPLFVPFAEGRFSDFSSIRFWHHRNLQFSEEDRRDGEWSIIAKFDTGLPAIAEIEVGESGRIFLFASGWHPADSQLALSTRFPPLLTRALTLAAPAQKDQRVQEVGDVIRPSELVLTEDWSLAFPDGESQAAAELLDADANETDIGGVTVRLTQPGRYTVTGQSELGDDVSVTMIASLAASESRTEMLPTGQLQVLGIGVESALADAGNDAAAEESSNVVQLGVRELEERQKWWRVFLLAGLSCLLVESLWASQLERRVT